MRHPSRFVLTLALVAAACDPAPAEAPAKTPASDEPPASEPAAEPAPSESATATSRPDEDVARDAGRKPQEVMDFFEIARGSNVAELMAGTGYYTELLARRVGPEGKVIAQNNAFVMDRFARGPLGDRVERMGASHVEVLENELDALELPRDLDAVVMVLFYHDTFWQDVDNAKMNAAVFAALKPGGVFGIVDHHAEEGSGSRDVKSIHRIDRALVEEQVLAAGFVLDASSDLLKRPDDDRKTNVFEMRGETDRFVLKFRKPSDAQP